MFPSSRFLESGLTCEGSGPLAGRIKLSKALLGVAMLGWAAEGGDSLSTEAADSQAAGGRHSSGCRAYCWMACVCTVNTCNTLYLHISVARSSYLIPGMCANAHCESSIDEKFSAGATRHQAAAAIDENKLTGIALAVVTFTWTDPEPVPFAGQACASMLQMGMVTWKWVTASKLSLPDDRCSAAMVVLLMLESSRMP